MEGRQCLLCLLSGFGCGRVGCRVCGCGYGCDVLLGEVSGQGSLAEVSGPCCHHACTPANDTASAGCHPHRHALPQCYIMSERLQNEMPLCHLETTTNCSLPRMSDATVPAILHDHTQDNTHLGE